MKLKKYVPYIISIAIALAVSGLSRLITSGGMQTYEALIKPALTPPSIVFPIVWTILFILMGISSAIIFQSIAPNRNSALTLYVVQLAANFIWSFLFFKLNAYLLSFLWLLILWGLILAMIISFYRVNKTASLLQIPYLLWVTFAGYLNLAIYLLNG